MSKELIARGGEPKPKEDAARKPWVAPAIVQQDVLEAIATTCTTTKSDPDGACLNNPFS